MDIVIYILIGAVTGFFVHWLITAFMLKGDLYITKNDQNGKDVYRFEIDDLEDLDRHDKLLIRIRHRD